MFQHLKHLIQVIIICILVASFGFLAAENTASITLTMPFYDELTLPAWVYMLAFLSIGILTAGIIGQLYMLSMTVKVKLLEKKLKKLQ